MGLVHESDRTETVLATEIDVADTTVQRTRGLMFRSSIPEEYALVFPFDDASRRTIHMLFVRFPIDVLWLTDERVQQVKTLSPWTGLGIAEADTVVELPAGVAADVERDDRVSIE